MEELAFLKITYLAILGKFLHKTENFARKNLWTTDYIQNAYQIVKVLGTSSISVITYLNKKNKVTT